MGRVVILTHARWTAKACGSLGATVLKTVGWGRSPGALASRQRLQMAALLVQHRHKNRVATLTLAQSTVRVLGIPGVSARWHVEPELSPEVSLSRLTQQTAELIVPMISSKSATPTLAQWIAPDLGVIGATAPSPVRLERSQGTTASRPRQRMVAKLVQHPRHRIATRTHAQWIAWDLGGSGVHARQLVAQARSPGATSSQQMPSTVGLLVQICPKARIAIFSTVLSTAWGLGMVGAHARSLAAQGQSRGPLML